MSINNEPKWVDVKAKGERTGEEFFGRFNVKPYLTHGEVNDVMRLAELYNRGIMTDPDQRAFNVTLAYLKFHIVATDAAWWTEKGGLDLIDANPVYAISAAIRTVQKPPEKAAPTPEAPPKA